MTVRAVACIAVAIGLLGCGEKAQTVQAGSTKKSDTPAWQTGSNPFVAPGWQTGDKAAWEAQLRNRAQSQNDFAVVK